MHRQNFPYSSVVIKNVRLAVAGRFEVTHPAVRPPHKSCIAENDPGLLRCREKAFPENAQNGRRLRAFRVEPRFSRAAVEEAVHGNCHDCGEHHGQKDDGSQPFS